MAEWLCSGLQSRGRRFDSDPSLHFFPARPKTFGKRETASWNCSIEKGRQ